jgi:hypothetical protein
VKVNVHEASHKMTIRAHSGGVIPVFPEGSLSIFSRVVCLTGSSGNELHGLRHDISLFIAVGEQKDITPM